MNVKDRLVRIINGFYKGHIGYITNEDKKLYKVSIVGNTDSWFSKNRDIIFLDYDINILDDDGSLLVNNQNSYCNWCKIKLKKFHFKNNNFSSYINYCPKCLR